ncbi:MAG: sigma-70 family RNA polymerase sigma factor [Gemmataceae bacterium]
MLPDDLARTLEQYRPVLRVLAATRLDPRVREKVDPSDLVQESLVKAYAHLAQFQGTTPAQLHAWVRQILANEMALAVRRFVGGPRGLEQSLEAALEESSVNLDLWLADLSEEPREEAQRREQLTRLMAGLADLPADQRAALELRYLQGLSPPQIAEREGKTTAAVAGLLRRGLEQLRQVLAEEA